MIFQGRLDKFNVEYDKDIKYHVLGTDISTYMLKQGNSAIYSERDISGIPFSVRKEYFLKNKDKQIVKVDKKIRKNVQFKRHNLISKDFPYWEPFDVIFCRNVLIYFDRDTQISVLRKLYNNLHTGGILFLGHSESIMGIDIPFKKLMHTTYIKM